MLSNEIKILPKNVMYNMLTPETETLQKKRYYLLSNEIEVISSTNLKEYWVLG
jgi:hypothetical protein